MRWALPVQAAVIAGWCWLRLGPFSSFRHGAPNEAWAESLSTGAPDTPQMECTEGFQPPPATPTEGVVEGGGARGGGAWVFLQGELGNLLCPEAVWKGHCPWGVTTGTRCRASGGRVVFVQTGSGGLRGACPSKLCLLFARTEVRAFVFGVCSRTRFPLICVLISP